jgi:hypothetical protein
MMQREKPLEYLIWCERSRCLLSFLFERVAKKREGRKQPVSFSRCVYCTLACVRKKRLDQLSTLSLPCSSLSSNSLLIQSVSSLILPSSHDEPCKGRGVCMLVRASSLLVWRWRLRERSLLITERERERDKKGGATSCWIDSCRSSTEFVKSEHVFG